MANETCGNCKFCKTVRHDPIVMIAALDLLGLYIQQELEDSLGICTEFEMLTKLSERPCQKYEKADLVEELCEKAGE